MELAEWNREGVGTKKQVVVAILRMKIEYKYLLIISILHTTLA
jgi:hypothetical protein